jgi:hypothetical protein
MKKQFRTFLGALICVLALIIHVRAAEISAADGKISLRAGILERTLDLSSGKGVTGAISVDGKPAVSTPLPELLLTVSRAEPNRRPDSFKPGVGGEFQSRDTFNKTATPEFLDDKRLGQSVGWVEPFALNGADLGAAFGPATYKATTEPNGLKQLIVQIPAKADGPLPGVVVELHYALYDEHPVIRKWVSLYNQSRWPSPRRGRRTALRPV